MLARREEIVKDTRNVNKKEFLYYLSRNSYEKEWCEGGTGDRDSGRVVSCRCCSSVSWAQIGMTVHHELTSRSRAGSSRLGCSLVSHPASALFF